MKNTIQPLLSRTRRYLTDELLPFWLHRSPDPEHGGFLTYFDRDGRPTGETTKTFLMQIRMLFTCASAHRAGFGDGQCAALAHTGARFILDHYWDERHGGWFWIADRDGNPTVTSKVGYGQCFAMYAFAEYALATGSDEAREAMSRTFDIVMRHMRDRENGGYRELHQRDWSPEQPGRFGGDRKTFDVHMHMMEALTSVYEASGEPHHRQALLGVIDVIETRMLHPDLRTGFHQFALDFTPLPAIRFDVAWGRDEGRCGDRETPLDVTSYAHNAEYAWLLLHAADVLGIDHTTWRSRVEPIFDHCERRGIDHECGGVYIEGPVDGDPTNQHKQFWQQAETLVAMLDAFALLGEPRYWRAFCNVHAFVFDKFVHHEGGGEWFAMLERDGTPRWDYLGDAWKISYHTVRSMIQIIARLERIAER